MRFSKTSGKSIEENVVKTAKVAIKKATKVAVKKTAIKTAVKKSAIKKPVKSEKTKPVEKKPTKPAKEKLVEKKPIKAKSEKKSVKAKTLPLSLQIPKVQEPQFVCSPNDLPAHIIEKVIRRAKRYFDGKNVKHRVSNKDEKSITFRFNRLSSKYSELPHNCVITVSKVG